MLLGWDRSAGQSFAGTEETGFVLVGDLPGGDNYSAGNAISADGSSIVGRGSSVNGTEGFRWTPSSGITGLGDLPGGKLRLLFELNPMAYIIENAGGAASDGKRAILDIKPESLDQREPIYIGCHEDVARAVEFLKG